MTGTETEFSDRVEDYCSNAAEARRVSRLVRRLAGSGTGTPVVVLPGSAAPQLVGTEGHWQTPTGKLVRHFMAYSRAGGHCFYVRSTLRVAVGKDWLLAACDLREDTPAEIVLDYVTDRLPAEAHVGSH
jgi:hypothetical protein